MGVKPSFCTGTVFLVVVLVAVSAAALALLAVLLYREVSGRVIEAKQLTDTSYTATAIRDKYPGYFRNRTEQELFEGHVFSETVNSARNVTETFENEFGDTCGFLCQEGPLKRRKRSSSKEIYHGCCKSFAMVKRRYTSRTGNVPFAEGSQPKARIPNKQQVVQQKFAKLFSLSIKKYKDMYHPDAAVLSIPSNLSSTKVIQSMKNIWKIERTLVQFDVNKQYFLFHSCKKASKCRGCTCSQDNSVALAVVMKIGVTQPTSIYQTELDNFYIDGCCRCVNT